MTAQEFREKLLRYDVYWDRIGSYGQREEARRRNAELERVAASDPALQRIFDEVVGGRAAA
jgi:hypothetical protein